MISALTNCIWFSTRLQFVHKWIYISRNIATQCFYKLPFFPNQPSLPVWAPVIIFIVLISLRTLILRNAQYIWPNAYIIYLFHSISVNIDKTTVPSKGFIKQHQSLYKSFTKRIIQFPFQPMLVDLRLN